MSMLEVAELILRRRDADCRVWAGVDQHGLRRPAEDGFDGALTLACVAAVQDSLVMCGRPGLGEEHQTAAFMGHLGTNLRWMTLAHALSADPDEAYHPPDVSWAYQSRPQEAKSGADFGIVVRPKDDDHCRVCLFQAKLDKRGKGATGPEIDVSHPLDAGESDKGTYPDRLRAAIANAGDPPGSWSEGVRRLVMDVAPQASYQIEALTRSHFLGNEGAVRRGGEVWKAAHWCHYLVWPTDSSPAGEPGGPRVASVIDVAAMVDATSCGIPRRFSFRDASPTFVATLLAVLTGRGPGSASPTSFVRVPTSFVREFLGRLADLLPSLQLTIVDQGSDGGLRDDLKAIEAPDRDRWVIREPAPPPEGFHVLPPTKGYSP